MGQHEARHEKGLARHRHGFEPSWPLDPPTPVILAVGFSRWGGGVYKQHRRPAPPRTPNPKSFSPSPAALSSRSLWLSSPIPMARDDSDGRRRPAAVPTSSSRPTAAPGLRRCRKEHSSSSSRPPAAPAWKMLSLPDLFLLLSSDPLIRSCSELRLRRRSR